MSGVARIAIGGWAAVICFSGWCADRIAPSTEYPTYWAYKGEPVLLLGGSKTDHIFLLDDLETHLDEIAAAGGNYVRCTMSQREGADLKPHLRLADGRFDLAQWNPAYWERFERCLEWCRERDIIVQIELWDRFDYSKEQWEASPWRPANNVNYTGEESGFADAYPAPAFRDRQPFFHTLQASPLYDERLMTVLKFQEAFVEKVLSISLAYGNVLYCVGNESSAPDRWSAFWAGFVTYHAEAAGATVYVTQMYDSARLEPVVSRPDVYGFIEGSKLLGPRRQAWAPKGEEQWLRVLEIHERVQRPINAVKIITNQDEAIARYSIQKFWRGLMAGMAAIRFHREPAGIGLRPEAQACLRAARLLEERVALWELRANLTCLTNREADEAYARVTPGEAYVVYFPRGGSVTLDLGVAEFAYDGRWLDIEGGQWAGQALSGQGDSVRLEAPMDRPCAVFLGKAGPSPK